MVALGVASSFTISDGKVTAVVLRPSVVTGYPNKDASILTDASFDGTTLTIAANPERSSNGGAVTVNGATITMSATVTEFLLDLTNTTSNTTSLQLDTSNTLDFLTLDENKVTLDKTAKVGSVAKVGVQVSDGVYRTFTFTRERNNKFTIAYCTEDTLCKTTSSLKIDNATKTVTKTVGEEMALEATAEGAEQEVTYRFIAYDEGSKKWITIATENNSNTNIWKATTAGTYVVYAEVILTSKDSQGETQKASVRSNGIQVIWKPSENSAVQTATPVPTSQVTASPQPASEEPKTTEKVPVTEEAKATEKVQITEEPKTTEKPNTTDKVPVTEGPKATEKTQITETPKATTGGANTATPTHNTNTSTQYPTSSPSTNQTTGNYNVTVSANGGNIAGIDKVILEWNATKSYSNLPKSTRKGYLFDGWYTASAGGDKITKSTISKVDKNSTLYAHWTKLTLSKVKINSAKRSGKTMTIKWNKVNSVAGYQHSYELGDTLTIADKAYRIVGIGTTPDYEAPYKEFSDSAVDSIQFGLAFVTEDTYETLKTSGKSDKTESYYYAYRLNGKLTDEELKEQIKEFDFSVEDVEDTYFQEYWDRTGGKKEELEDGIADLNDGGEELYEGLKELAGHNQELTDSAEQLLAIYAQMPTADVAKKFTEALKEYTVGVKKITKGSKKISKGIGDLEEETDELLDEYFELDISNLTSFLKVEDNPRVGAAGDDQIINKLGGLIAGVIIMVLFTYVISVFVIHGIEKESSFIGALYALGVKRKDLIRHYLQLPVIVTILAGIIGTGIAFSNIGIPVQMQDCYDYFSISKLQILYPQYLMVYSIIMPPLVAIIVNYFVIRKSLSNTVLSLLREEKKESKISNINLGEMGFIRLFQIRQMFREVRTGFTVIFGMFISLLILMLGLNCYVMCENIKNETETDTKFAYMYTYKYPEENVAEGGEEAYAKTLKREAYGYNLEVTLLGITDENPYFDAQVEKGENKVVISSAVAQKYKLDIGDDIVLKDEEEERNYAFVVTDILQYGTGFYVFMDIDSMRELFGESEDYYNVVFSDKELHIPAGRLYATTSREELINSSGVFVDLMMPMVIMMTSVAVLIFCVVMYLMLKVMVDRSAYGISLVKIFGYRTGEIRKLYLNGNFYTILIGALVSIPLSKSL